MIQNIHIFPLPLAEVTNKTNLFKEISLSLNKNHIPLQKKDILIVTQKIISKAEGRIVALKTVTPSPFAKTFARNYNKDPRYIEVVLRESKRIVRMDHGVMICETLHGFICANAGVDASNMKHTDTVSLLPQNPDASAKKLREQLETLYEKPLAVFITDTWGRPWREGQINITIGSSGIEPLVDYRGKHDSYGYTLQASVLAVADELASAAELVMGKVNAIPAAIIRGYSYIQGEHTAQSLLRDPAIDMFR